MADSADGRTFGQLVSDLTGDVSRLVRSEAELIRVEFAEKAKELGKAGAEFAAGAILLLAALMILLQALVLALSKIMDPVWASLLVGVAVAIVGALLLRTGAKTADPAKLRPERTAQALRKDAQLVKEQVK
ncbi:MAG TPA: phage holin family protein [Caulobacteraceae bacterium]|nr:phage holin family protein [Caulobacteraceae bacterium]